MLSAFSFALGKYFRDIIRTDIHLTLLGGAFGSLVLKFFITGIGFITGIVLARCWGRPDLEPMYTP